MTSSVEMGLDLPITDAELIRLRNAGKITFDKQVIHIIDHIFAQREALRSLRQDAARYRWLRDTPWPDDIDRIVRLHQNAVWDSVIDAALRADKGAK